MSQLFYRPENAWAADFIPFYKDGVYYLFYLLDWRNRENHGEGTPWYMISTKDFVNFKEHGEMLSRGNIDEQDLYVFTGCVIEDNEKYHIFYTGHNPHLREKERAEQGVMHAISDDLINWTKIPEDTFFAPIEGYEPHDWRDPFVFWNEEENEYWMLLAARVKNSPHIRKGCTAVCASKDLKHWEVRDPLWAPELHFTHECPDLFKMGDWWYLVFSEFTDKCVTRYRMSKSLKGPWISPNNDSFDGRAFYAAKTASDGEKRYIFGWNPTKDKESDSHGWQWGGNLVVHEVIQNKDGSLDCKIPDTVEKAFSNSQNFHKDLTITAYDRGSIEISDLTLPDIYKIDVDIVFKPTTKRCGIILNYIEQSDNGYCFFLEPYKNRIVFDFWPNHPWGRFNTRGCERPLELNTGDTYHLSIIVDHTCCTAYLNGQVALSARMYDNKNGKIGFIVTDGEAIFKNANISYF